MWISLCPAGNSPQLRRNRSAAETFSHVFRNPFNSLRRTKSTYTAITNFPGPSNTDYINGVSNATNLNTRQSSSLTDVNQQNPFNQKTSAPALLAAVNQSKSLTAKTSNLGTHQNGHAVTSNEQELHKGENLSPTIRVRSPTLTDSSSVKTLTGADVNARETRESESPNPASAAVGGHSRHTTCSSVESEGFGSITSEELSLEELAHIDLSHWSKEVSSKTCIINQLKPVIDRNL